MNLQPALNDDGISLNPSGVIQAWAGVYAAYSKRPDVFSHYVQFGGTIDSLLTPINDFDGNYFTYKQGNDFYVFIGPQSGKEDYAAWGLLGIIPELIGGVALFPPPWGSQSVSAVGSTQIGEWANTVWQASVLDIFDRILSKITPFLQADSRIQLVGFSMSGALAQMIGLAMAVRGITNRVNMVGFGMPRGLAPIPAWPANLHPVRFTLQGDPIDLIPPVDQIGPIGGPLPNRPTPTQWGSWGERYLFLGQSGNLLQQDDPAWPGDVAFIATVPLAITNHVPKNYSGAVKAYYAKSLALPDSDTQGIDAMTVIDLLGNGQDPPPPPPIVTFPPLPPSQIGKDQPLPPPPQVEGGLVLPNYITPFISPGTSGTQRVTPGVVADPY